MTRRVPVRLRVPALACLVILVGCGQAQVSPAATPAGSSSAPAIASAGRTAPSTAGAASSGPLLGDALPACPSDAAWRCLVVAVPVDPSDPSKGTLPIHAYVQPHLDRTRPPLEPIFVSPGGPGASIWTDHGFLPLMVWQDRHDTVLIDPRGVGESAKIDCEALQSEIADLAALRAGARACATSLGPRYDRYGSADAARDIEAVRQALGVPSFDYYGASYATVTEQAYASRHPDHIHAIVLDSGFPMQSDHLLADDFIGVGAPTALLRAIGLLCARYTPCAGGHPAPADELTKLATDLHVHPLHATDALGHPVTVDEAALISIILGLGYDAKSPALSLLNAATAYERGDRDPLVAMAADHPIFPIPPTDLSGFSMGDNAAALCVDTVVPWAAGDPPATRLSKLVASVHSFGPDAFAPFSSDGWLASQWPWYGTCLDWPAPTHPAPVIADASAFAALPALILSGDVDMNAQTELVRPMQQLFPKSTFMVVAAAGHNAANPFWGGCAGQAVARFFDTLTADASFCAPK